MRIVAVCSRAVFLDLQIFTSMSVGSGNVQWGNLISCQWGVDNS